MIGSSLPLALSLSSSLKTVGDYAGFAAIIGLAVLAVLYFSQAREVKRLREWAGRAPERDAEQEDRILEQSQAQARTGAAVPGVGLKEPSGTPATAAGATVREVKPIGAASTPAAAASSPAAATKPEGDKTAPAKPAQPSSTPKPVEPEKKNEAKVDETQIVRPGTAVPSSTPPAAATAKAETKPDPSKPDSAKPEPVKPPSKPTPDVAPQATPASPQTTPPATGRPQPKAPQPVGAAPLRRSTPSAATTARTAPKSPRTARTQRDPAAAPRREKKTQSKSGLPTPVIVIGTLVAIALVIFLFVQLTDGGAPQKPNQTTPVGQTGSGSGKKSTKAQPLARGKINVSVLNGTTVPGLAAQVADQVQSAGFKRGTVTNAADQQLASTAVFYSSGNSRAAKEVAKILKTGSPKPIDPGTQSIAGASANVVVVVGSDRTQ